MNKIEFTQQKACTSARDLIADHITNIDILLKKYSNANDKSQHNFDAVGNILKKAKEVIHAQIDFKAFNAEFPIEYDNELHLIVEKITHDVYGQEEVKLRQDELLIFLHHEVHDYFVNCIADGYSAVTSGHSDL